MLDTTAMLDQIVPASEAAVIAFGLGVLDRSQTEATDATVRLGQRLLGRLLRRGADAGSPPEPVRTAIERLAEAGTDPDLRALYRAELRIALRTALTESPGLAAEVSALLPAPPSAPAVHAEGERSVAVGGDSSGNISTGDRSGYAPPQ